MEKEKEHELAPFNIQSRKGVRMTVVGFFAEQFEFMYIIFCLTIINRIFLFTMTMG